MKQILSTNKWWFVAAYIFGLFFSVVYCIAAMGANEADAVFTNALLFVISHFCLLGTVSLSDPLKIRKKLLWRTFSLYILFNGMLLFITPEILGLVGSYALFVATGYLQTSILKDTEKREDKNINSFKYYVWGMISLMMLFLGYWQM